VAGVLALAPGRAAAQQASPTNPYALELRPSSELGLGAGWAVPSCDCDLTSSVAARALALWRDGNIRFGVIGDYAQFPWRVARTSHHAFAAGLARVYSESGPWDIHFGLAFGPAFSPPHDECSVSPVVFGLQPGVGANVWLAPRWSVGMTATYVLPVLGAYGSCSGGATASDNARQQVLGVGVIAVEVLWGATDPKRPHR